MKVSLTEQAATVLLSEEEVHDLADGKPVMGAPMTEFLSPFGKRIVIVSLEDVHHQLPPTTKAARAAVMGAELGAAAGKQAPEDIYKVYDSLGLSRDDYMMLYWDLPNKKVMGIDHLGHARPVGDVYDLEIEDGHVGRFKIKALS